MRGFVVQKKSGNNPFVGVRSDAWTLDLLGNWTARSTTVPTPAVTVEHAVDDQNKIQSITTTVSGNSPTSKTFKYDGAGNLAFDGTYAYQYDAWDRLVEVEAAHLSGGSIVSDGLVKHYTYDALGRLARTLSPYPSLSGQSGGKLRSERFIYDGVRRLQEVWIDQVRSLAGATALGGSAQALAAAANSASQDLDQATAPASFEVDLIPLLSPAPSITVAREYVYGAGDKGIDEVLVQFDAGRNAVYLIQDEGGDVVGAFDLGGAGGSARIVEQIGYDPYGKVISDYSGFSHAPIHMGHKGLFVDRLDVGVATGGGTENSRLAVGGTLLAYARNRTYSPDLGRWIQMDPNASGLSTLGKASNGHGLGAGADALDLEGLYADGTSLYQYVWSAPWRGGDPLGLSGEYDAFIDFGMNFIPSFGLEMYVRTGATAYRLARDLTEAYSSNLMSDSEWAGNWDLGDDLHSRLDSSWIAAVYRQRFDEYYKGADPTGGFIFGNVGKGLLKGLEGSGNGWRRVERYMSADAARYQARITKRPGFEFFVNGRAFDGYMGGQLLEAKGPGYAKLLFGKNQEVSHSVAMKLYEQAKAQRRAAGRKPIIWHVAEEKVADYIKETLQREFQINVRWTKD